MQSSFGKGIDALPRLRHFTVVPMKFVFQLGNFWKEAAAVFEIPLVP